MDFATALHAMVDKNRRERFSKSDQLSLGELILKCESISDKQKLVVFDFGKIPQGLDSWRGIYAELAIEYGDEGSKTLDWLIDALKEAVGKEYTGWKGGEFAMSRQTPIWVANSGESGVSGYPGKDSDYPYVGVVDIIDGDSVTIITKEMDC